MVTASSLQDMYRRPGFLLKRCHQVSMAIFLAECREFSITQSQYGCLRALILYPGIDQICLGRLVGLDRSTAGLVIKALSDRGLIERVVNDTDKRRMRLKVSADGVIGRSATSPRWRLAHRSACSGLPRELRAAFLDMLEFFLAGHDAVIDVDQVSRLRASRGRAGRATCSPRRATQAPEGWLTSPRGLLSNSRTL